MIGVLLADLTSPEIGDRAAAGAVLAVPVGSTEQHGPHLPLATDTDVAVALCTRLARCRDVLVAPAVAYGSSGEHAGFAGTVSIGQEALRTLLVELGRSACSTFGRVVFVSAHGGNAAPVSAAVALLRSESRSVSAWSPQWDGDAHAGFVETSLQLALGGRVLMDRAVAGNRAPVADLLPAMRAGGVRAVAPNGVLGDPAGASAAAGEALLDALTDSLVAHVDQVCVDSERSGARQPFVSDTNLIVSTEHLIVSGAQR